MFEQLRKTMTSGSCDTVGCVHGYNVSFNDAVKAAAELKLKLEARAGKHINMILFSWPSDGSMTPWWGYASDRNDAAASGGALARALLKFADFTREIAALEHCRQRVHLVAHSMGN